MAKKRKLEPPSSSSLPSSSPAGAVDDTPSTAEVDVPSFPQDNVKKEQSPEIAAPSSAEVDVPSFPQDNVKKEQSPEIAAPSSAEVDVPSFPQDNVKKEQSPEIAAPSSAAEESAPSNPEEKLHTDDAMEDAPSDAVPVEVGLPADANGSSETDVETQAEPGDVVPGPTSQPEPETEEEPESMRDLLEPLSKELLIDLLLKATSRHADVFAEIAELAGSDPAHRKIFVHGLGWDTTTDALAAAFSGFGEIEDCNAIRDKATGKSKGYGFVLFRHRSGARAALREPQKKIGFRMTACQLASAGPVPAPATVIAPSPAPVSALAPTPAPTSTPTHSASEYTQRKIYINNVGADVDPQRLLQFFAQYGEIEEGPLGLDKQTGKPRGFCLFVYKSVESARKALEEPQKNFEGHLLHCQKAIDGPKGQRGGWAHGVGSHSGGHFAKTGYAVAAAARHSAHLMAPTQGGYGQGVQPASTTMDPVQALTSLLANPTAALGLSNLLGSLSSAAQVGGQGVLPQISGSVGFGGQGAVYGGPAYRRGQQSGHFGARPPYTGR